MSDKKQATWGGRFTESPNEKMIRFSESVSFDQRLAKFDIAGSKAHAKMLAHTKIIEKEESEAICQGLENLLEEIESGQFEWKIELEDVHMNIEQVLTERIPSAAKLHTARSRNDQVATDMRLFFKDACKQIESALNRCMKALWKSSNDHQNIIIPGYTHLQRAQPVSIAHHLLAYIEMLWRDLARIKKIHSDANFCPLGSGAIAGTTLPIDREFTAKELGFVDAEGNPQVTQNSMDAVSDRDLFIDFTQACATIGIHLSRIAEDLIIWNTSEFGFVKLPDAYTTGSSLMPQKKNPDSLELIRGKSAKLIGNSTTLMSMVKNLPLTYNRDLQEDKPPVFDSLDTTLDILLVLEGTLEGMEPNPERCKAAVSDPLLLATDVVDYLVIKGCPFRDAHHVVGALVSKAEELNLSINEIPEEELKEINPLLESDWIDCFDLKTALEKRNNTGMPGPEAIEIRLSKWQEILF